MGTRECIHRARRTLVRASLRYALNLSLRSSAEGMFHHLDERPLFS